MKHIKKKFQFEAFLTEEQEASFKAKSIQVDKEEGHKLKLPKGLVGILETDDGKYFTAFPHKIDGKQFFIPEPDPVLIYFNNAYLSFRELESTKKDLIKALELKTMDEGIKNELYTFFGNSFGFATMLFTSIEAYINKKIPIEYEYRDTKNSKTELYDKNQIERYLPFDTKFKTVLKEITKKDFTQAYPIKEQYIKNLREFRDSIIHTKTSKEGATPYDYLYKKSLNFKYAETIESVKDWLNYYEGSNYVEDCDCGKDF